MAISIRAVGAPTVTNINGGASAAVAVPAGVQAGDYLVMLFRHQPSNDGNAASPGWTLLTPPKPIAGETSTQTRVTAMLGRVAGSNEPGSYTVTVPAGGSGRVAAFMVALTGVDTSSPVAARQYVRGDNTAGVSAPLWPAAAEKFVLEIYVSEFTSGNDHALAANTTPLTPLLTVVAPSTALNQSRTALFAWSGVASPQGLAARTMRSAGGMSSSSAWSVAFNAAAPTPPPIPQGLLVEWRKIGDARTKARLTALLGGAERVVTDLGYIPRGYASVDSMLSADEFMMAHRGGSADWPEMTRRAYTNAAAWGAGMLEFSTWRTSDGVWVGSHDATTAREFPDHPSVDIRTVTWADLAGYRTRDGGHPLYRLTDFLDEFARTHICMVDNKAAAFRSEYLDILDARGGPSRIMNKSWSGSAGNRDVARLAALRGYESWGFIYDAEIANLPTWKEHWTAMGLEYSAEQTSWDSLIANGPDIVIAHIMPSAAAVQTAKTKILQAMANTGRTVRYGYQISGVRSAIPRRLPASVTLL